ncbi:MAG: chemotaxis protein CheW [bacterium]
MTSAENPKFNKYYELLGLRPDATLGEVKRSARALFLKFHPDLNPENRARCEEKTKTIVEAYKAVLEQKVREPAEAAESAPQTEAEPGTFEVLAFDLSNRTLAVPTGLVKEIVRVKDGLLDNIGLVSDAFPYVAGVFCRGSEVSMLWNLHRQLGLRESPISSDFERNKIVVVVLDDSAVSFLVDEIRGIMTLERNSLLSPSCGFDFESSYLDGVIKTEEATIGLLNLRNVFYGSG